MNSNTHVVQWLMGLVAVLLVGALSLVIQSITTDIAQIQSTQLGRGERIAALEAQATANKEHILAIRGDLQYIKQRLDQLLPRAFP